MAELKSSSKKKPKKLKRKTKSRTKLKIASINSIDSVSRKYVKKKQKKCVHFNTNYEAKDDTISIKKRKKKQSKHRRQSAIIQPKKENRALSTWSKMEIAEWLQLNWYKNQDYKNNTQLLSHINKIKREKKFNGQNLETLNNRRIIILAKRQLGLKKGDKDYKIFIKRIHELQSKYSSKKLKLSQNNSYKNNIKYRKRNRSRSVPYESSSTLSNRRHIKKKTPQNKKYKTMNISNYKNNMNKHMKSKTKTLKTRKKSSIVKKNRKYKYKKTKSKSSFLPLIERSYTSPAISDIDNKYMHKCGVTDDELLTLFSYGHSDEIDTDYDGDINNYNDYMTTQTMTPSPKNFDTISNINTFNYNVNIINCNNNNTSENNKTTVIPSIFSLSDVDSNNKNNYIDICLSPIVSSSISSA
eukprot:527571_1